MSTPATSASAPVYLGGVLQSLEFLPQWYQMLSLSGVLCVVYLRNNPVITWLVIHLHSSFGTEEVWDPSYQGALERMTFNERVCFTLYGVSLALVSVAIYKILCQDTYKLGWQATQLFPDKRIYTAIIAALMFAVDIIVLRSEIAGMLSRPRSLAYVALHDFEGIASSGFDPRLADSNKHFVIQLELLKCVVSHFCRRRLPPVFASAVYRLTRDVPRRMHVSLRWYMATVSYAFIGLTLLRMYMNHIFDDVADWATMLWSVLYLAFVNYVYGPSKRSGKVAAASTADCIKEGLRGLSTCCAMWGLATIGVLTFVVSVHVVELICIWLLLALLIVWVPAIIDSCAINYITFIVGGVCYIAHKMEYVETFGGSIRLGVMMAIWWTNLCLAYNAVVNLSRSRYVGIALVLWVLLWALAPRDCDYGPSGRATENEVIDVIVLCSRRFQWMVEVANLEPLGQIKWLSANGTRSSTVVFLRILNSGVCSLAALTTAITFIGRSHSAEAKEKLRRQHTVLVTFSVLLRKLIRTIVQSICVLSFILSDWSFRRFILPRIISLLPTAIARGISGAAACIVLGVVTDVKEFIYETLVRFLGIMDPPQVGEDGEEKASPQVSMDDL